MDLFDGASSGRQRKESSMVFEEANGMYRVGVKRI